MNPKSDILFYVLIIKSNIFDVIEYLIFSRTNSTRRYFNK